MLGMRSPKLLLKMTSKLHRMKVYLHNRLFVGGGVEQCCTPVVRSAIQAKYYI